MAKEDLSNVREILITEQQIQDRLKILAQEVDEYYQDLDDDLVLISVLKGGIYVMVDFSKKLTTRTLTDYMSLSSYGLGTKSSGVVRVLKDLDIDINNKHVLIVEDIIDSGLTLSWLVDTLRNRGALSVEILSLLKKEIQDEDDRIEPKWLGFKIPDKFVVGYGMDYGEHYRTLPYIGVLDESLI